MRLHFVLTARLEADQPALSFSLVGEIVLLVLWSDGLHGGVSHKKMILPVALLTPRDGA